VSCAMATDTNTREHMKSSKELRIVLLQVSSVTHSYTQIYHEREEQIIFRRKHNEHPLIAHS
jgi:hypothetical protein